MCGSGRISNSVVSSSSEKDMISVRWARSRRPISLVEQLPRANQITLGGAPKTEDRALKSESLDTMV